MCCPHDRLSHIRAGGWIRRDPRFLKLVGRVQSLLEEAPETFDSHALGNVINGLAKLGHHPGEAFFERFKGACLWRGFERFKAQELANVLNGFAKFEHDPGEAFLRGFTEECLRRCFAGFIPQGLANTINALAKLEYHPGHAFLDELTGECLDQGFEHFDPQHLANTMNGLASFCHHPGEQMLANFVEELLRREFSGFNSQGLANTISAMVVLNFKPSDECLMGFLKACKARAVLAVHPSGSKSDDFSLKAISSFVLSLSALEALDRPGADELFEALDPLTEALLAKAGEKDQESAGLVRNVKYALLGHERSSPGLQKLCGAVKRAWRGPEVPQPPTKPRPSRLQQDVARVFKIMGWQVTEEERVAGKLLSVDVLLGGPGGVAVEVDGPSHFFSNRPNEPTGNTKVKRRRLRGMVERGELRGFIRVEYHDWDKAKTDEDKAALLRGWLRAEGLEL
jgi:hypothetical protein